MTVNLAATVADSCLESRLYNGSFGVFTTGELEVAANPNRITLYITTSFVNVIGDIVFFIGGPPGVGQGFYPTPLMLSFQPVRQHWLFTGIVKGSNLQGEIWAATPGGGGSILEILEVSEPCQP